MKPEDHLDQSIRELSRGYNQPPETPREAIWERIVAERQANKIRRLDPGARRHWGWLGAAAVALLVIGIGIGRQLTPQPDLGSPDGPGWSRGAESGLTAVQPTTAYRLKMGSHLNRADILLTQFSSMDAGVTTDQEFETWAKSLLLDTRLLLGSPAASNAEYRSLLEDLEFVLVQIVHASATRRSEERRWIAEGLDQRGVMEKLRLLIPTVTGT